MVSVRFNNSIFDFIRKITFLIILLTGVSNHVNCQAFQLKPVTIPDTVYRRSALKTSIGLVSLYLGIWAYDKAAKKPFADISLETIRHNFKTGFLWDNDGFLTNMWDHPMQGNFNFNIARYNGYNHWQSYIYNFGGSLFWEMLLENEPPSLNDQITTVVGGQAIGEVCYRISDCIMTPYRRSFKRVGTELANTLLVPTETIRRIINGDIWEVKYPEYSQISEKLEADFVIGFGYSRFIQNSIFENDLGRMTLNFNSFYNDPFSIKINKPFDHFNFKLAINLTSDQPVINKMSIEGAIWTKRNNLDNENKLIYGIFQHYDYFDTDSTGVEGHQIPYKISVPASYGLGLMHKYKSKEITNVNEIYTNIVLMGAGVTDHYNLNKRNYNFGPGYSYKIRSTAIYKDLVKIYAEFMSFRIFTPKGTTPETIVNDDNFYTFQGDIGNSTFSILNAGIEFNLIRRFVLHFELMHSFRKNIYKYYPEVHQADNEINMALFYRL